MARQDEYIDLEEVPDARINRRSDGGTYLVVVDESSEFQVALRYAARRAQAHRAHLGILQIVNIEAFTEWSNVEERMRREMRGEAEKFIWNIAKNINELNELRPCLYVAEGARNDTIIDIINEDMNIKSLILAGGTQGSSPGPLVNYFTGKGLSRLRVPVVVVPGDLSPAEIDSVAL